MPLLECRRVFAGYDSGNVLHGVDLMLDRGELVAVIGRNGVGKSTLMKTIMGLLALTGGSIVFMGKEIGHEAASRRSAAGIGYVPQGRQIFPELSIEENLLTGEQVASARRDRRLRYDLVYKYFPILRERRGQLGGTLSGGEQQMLAIARALVGDPLLLLLDEPSAGIQPSIIQEISRSLAELNRQEQLSILFVEQNIFLITQLAQRSYAVDKGRIVAALDRGQSSERDYLVRYLAI